MTFVRLVVSELHCPRCNAWAQLRIEEERNTICVLYIVCSKCKLRKYFGITTRRAVTLTMKRQKLTDKLNSPTINEQTKSRLRKSIAVLTVLIDKERLKTGG